MLEGVRCQLVGMVGRGEEVEEVVVVEVVDGKGAGEEEEEGEAEEEVEGVEVAEEGEEVIWEEEVEVRWGEWKRGGCKGRGRGRKDLGVRRGGEGMGRLKRWLVWFDINGYLCGLEYLL